MSADWIPQNWLLRTGELVLSLDVIREASSPVSRVPIRLPHPSPLAALAMQAGCRLLPLQEACLIRLQQACTADKPSLNLLRSQEQQLSHMALHLAHGQIHQLLPITAMALHPADMVR